MNSHVHVSHRPRCNVQWKLDKEGEPGDMASIHIHVQWELNTLGIEESVLVGAVSQFQGL